MSSNQKPSRRDDDKSFENVRLKQDKNLPPGYFAVVKQVNNIGCENAKFYRSLHLPAFGKNYALNQKTRSNKFRIFLTILVTFVKLYRKLIRKLLALNYLA